MDLLVVLECQVFVEIVGLLLDAQGRTILVTDSQTPTKRRAQGNGGLTGCRHRHD